MTIQWAFLSWDFLGYDIPEPQTIRATGYEVLEAKMTSLAASQLQIHHNQLLEEPPPRCHTFAAFEAIIYLRHFDLH